MVNNLKIGQLLTHEVGLSGSLIFIFHKIKKNKPLC